jgi:nitroreductase
MNTLDAIHTRRSIRSFTKDPISEEDMRVIVQAAAAAPSGGNTQMWAFISIRDPKRLMAVRALSPGIIAVPTAVIVICLDQRRRSSPLGGMDEMWGYDLGAAMQNILLAAHELGLGGCAIGSFNSKGLSTLLNLPPEVEPKLLISLGKPKAIPQPPKKRSLEEVYLQERYGE